MPKVLTVVVDMQYDFAMPSGALYVPGAERLLVPMIEHVVALDPSDVVFTADHHRPEEYDGSPEAAEFPPHCVAGTKGAEVLLPTRGSAMLEKPVFDVWAAPAAAAYLERKVAFYDCVEIIGVAADYCVRYAYEGFAARGIEARVIASLTVGIKENPYA